MAEAAAPGDATALPPASILPLRVLTCQTDGTLGASVSANIARWSTLLEADELTTAEIDVVHFPETAFSRYIYSSTEDLTEYGGAEEAGAGPVFAFLRALALKFDCYVIAGFAERDTDATCFYNSLYVVSRDGSLLLTHRKIDLFQPDCVWCQPASANYTTLTLTNREGQPFKAGLMLCQELVGPQDGDHSAMLVAHHFVETSVRAVFFSSCWPMGDGSRTFGGIWEKQMQPLVEAGREWAYFVANGCGSEPNCMTEAQWDGRYPRMQKLKVLAKRGCSGAKKYCGAAASTETSELLGPGEVLPVREEGWQLHCTELREF
jgi:predicted amidohydrolase